MSAPSRNAPCPCGSGKKYKRCCGQNQTPAAAARPGVSPAGNYEQALVLFRQGNLAAAGRMCQQLLRSRPRDGAVLELLSVIALQQGQLDQAATLLQHQLRLQPKNPIAHSNLCMALHELGRDQEAYRHGAEATRLDPKLAEAHNNLGNVLRALNRLGEARESYERAVALGSKDPRVHVNAGLASQLLGDLQTAEKRYRDVLRMHADFPPAHNNLGAVMQNQGRYEEAATHFERVLSLQPDDPEAHNNLGSLCLETDDKEKAQACFEQAIILDPNYVGAYINLGLLQERKNDYEQAWAHFDKALSLDPDNPSAHCNMGCSLLELGDYQQAVEHLVRALEVDPNLAKAYAVLGEARLRQDDMVAAKKYIDHGLKLAPWDADIHRAKALLAGAESDLPTAESEWEHVIDKRPTSSEGYLGLARLYADSGLPEKARAVFRRAEEAGISDPHLFRGRSRMEEEHHRLDKAEKYARKAAELDPADPTLPILQARLAARQKEFETAQKILDGVDTGAIREKNRKSAYFFELGAVLDKLGCYSDAFAAYRKANDLKNEYIGLRYHKEIDQQNFARWAEFFSGPRIDRIRQISAELQSSGPQPIFIVGFPRSGTSLLEQILGCHPEIEAAGELPYMRELDYGRAAGILGSQREYPDCLADPDARIDERKLYELRDFYLSNMRASVEISDETRWVTDKWPHNLLRLGLITLLFPNAPIVHIKRHPLNACLSAYFSNFEGGHRYTSSLESTAEHYRLVMDLANRYTKALSPLLLEISYESLVEDQEAIVRRVLEFIGAPWNDGCLKHHESKRLVRTASYEQVTQKIYRSSLDRYRNYLEEVRPIVPILRDTIERMGYKVD